jgi:four helix bundle protein
MYNEWPMNNSVNAPMDLRDRTLLFSRRIIRFLRSLPRDPLIDPIRGQVVRSATSIGANFSEAKDSASRKDFRNKTLISKKEASETLYWLQLLEEFTSSSVLRELQTECKEIILILQKIITTVGH